MAKKQGIPGIIRPTGAFRTTDGKEQPKTIEEKRSTILRTIERFRRGEKGSARLEGYDYEQKASVIRVLYGSAPLPIFDGQAAAVIEPQADRDALWEAIISRIEAGDYDKEIEEVSKVMLNNLRQARDRKRRRDAA